MSMVNTRIHMICGFCGSSKAFTYEINRGDSDIDGYTFEDTASIHCSNCGSTSSLDELLNYAKGRRPITMSLQEKLLNDALHAIVMLSNENEIDKNDRQATLRELQAELKKRIFLLSVQKDNNDA